MDEPTRRRAEPYLYVALVLAACVVVAPLAPWLMLAFWVASLVRPVHTRIRRLLRGSGRAAAVLVLGLAVMAIGPIVLIAVSLAHDAVDLANRLIASRGGKAALASLVSGGDADGGGLSTSQQVIALVREHGDRALRIVTIVLGAATNAAIGMLIFLYGTFTSLVDGPKAFAWFRRNLPFSTHVMDRMSAAFDETGRGLFIGVGVTGGVQALVATIAYYALDVPRPLVLGLLTFFASVLPSFGTALIWVPVAAGLAITGRTGAALIMAAVGAGVIGTVDNLLRPVIANRADAHLPTFVVMIGMFGGLASIGAWGVLLGPLALRLAMEALALSREATSPVAPAEEK